MTRNERWWILFLCLAAFLVTLLSPVDGPKSDVRGSLLTSQALLQHGSLQLDSYSVALPPGNGAWLNGHRYYTFPLGTPVYSLPFVWIANRLGMDMAQPEDEDLLGNVLSAGVVALSCFLIYQLCRCFTSVPYALLFSTALVFGSSIASTMGVALWSTDLAVLFALLALLLLALDRAGRIKRINPYLLGFCLFSAYLCRPTMSLFVAAVLLYCLVREWPVALKTAATCLVLLALFSLFSWTEYGQLLPSYYWPTRLAHPDTLGIALYGLLLSPARGFFVYSPYLVLPLVGLLFFWKTLLRQPLFWLAAGWTGLHWIAVARFPLWWGGGCFGSRLMADVLPAGLLLLLLVWSEAEKALQPLGRRLAIGAFALLAIPAILVNTGQGLFNRSVAAWNGGEGIFRVDSYPGFLFDWKYPQFLASPEQLAARDLDYENHPLPPFTMLGHILWRRVWALEMPEGFSVPPEMRVFLDTNWYPFEEDTKARWMAGRARLWIFSEQEQDVSLRFLPAAMNERGGLGSNGSLTVTWDGAKSETMTVQAGQTYQIQVHLLPGSNQVLLELAAGDFVPHEVIPGSPDLRRLGIAFYAVEILP